MAMSNGASAFLSVVGNAAPAKAPEFDPESLGKLVLNGLTEGPATVQSLSQRLGQPLGNVAGAVDYLKNHEMVIEQAPEAGGDPEISLTSFAAQALGVFSVR